MVAFAGPIGFVGLIVPHVLADAPRARQPPAGVPAALLGGGAFLLLADTLARNVVAPAELSVGVITAFCGAPFFIYLLRARAPEAEPVTAALVECERVGFAYPGPPPRGRLRHPRSVVRGRGRARPSG